MSALGPDPRVVVILGMHRSGTSCLAGSLQQAGLFLGGVNEAAPHNAKGNRENRAIMDFHDTLLRANGGSWNQPPESVAWGPRHKARRDELIATYPADKTWGFKDPRTLLTVEGWLEALPQARCVGTFRHPLAVCKSLQSRNSFSRSNCLGLWMTYNRLLLRHQRHFGFNLICFDWPQERYHDKLVRIALELGLSEPSGFSFFDPALRCNEVPGDAELPTPAADLYRRLEEIAA